MAWKRASTGPGLMPSQITSFDPHARPPNSFRKSRPSDWILFSQILSIRNEGRHEPMKSTFLALAIATAALNISRSCARPRTGLRRQRTQYFEGGGAVSGVLQRSGGHSQVDGYGFSRVADEHPASPVIQTAGRKCWYVLDVQLCDRRNGPSFCPWGKADDDDGLAEPGRSSIWRPALASGLATRSSWLAARAGCSTALPWPSCGESFRPPRVLVGGGAASAGVAAITRSRCRGRTNCRAARST